MRIPDLFCLVFYYNGLADSDTNSSSSDIDENSICQAYKNTKMKEESTKLVSEIKASRKKTQKSVPTKRITNIKQQNYFKTPSKTSKPIVAAKRPRNMKKQEEVVSSMEADIQSDIWAETSPSEDAEKQRPSKYSDKSVATAEHPKIPERQMEIISAIEGDITQEMEKEKESFNDTPT